MDILQALHFSDGALPFNDRSEPHVIEDYMKMSKGRFKKAVGYLYKLRFIEIMEGGLKLTDEGAAEAAQRFAHLARRSENADAGAGEHADRDAGVSGVSLSDLSGEWADSDSDTDTGSVSGFDAERDVQDNEGSSEQADSSGRADYADIDALADNDASGDSDPMVDEVVHAVARARRMNGNGGYQPPFSVDRAARSESDVDFDMERPAEAVIESSDENREEVERRAQEVLGESLEDFGDFAGRSSFNAALDNAASASDDKSDDGVYGRERHNSDRRDGRRADRGSDRRERFGGSRDDRGSRYGDRDSGRRGGFGGRRDERRDSRDGFRRDGDRRDDRREGRESRFSDRRSGSGSFGRRDERRDDRGFGSRRDGNREERRGSRGDRFDSRRSSFGGRDDRRDGGRDRGFGSRHDFGSRGSRFDRDSRTSRGGHAFRGQR